MFHFFHGALYFFFGGQIRYGHLAVLPDMASLTASKVASLSKVIQAVKDADTGTSTDGEPVNVLHVALMKVG